MLRDPDSEDEFCIGDLILLELLQGASGEHHAGHVAAGLSCSPTLNLLDTVIATRAAQNVRLLRALGVTIRKTADLIIGTFCMERGLAWLRADRDFDAMARHLPLRCR